MTVVSQPAREMGMMAARMLIDEIEGRHSIVSPMLLGTKLIVRDSCSPPRVARTANEATPSLPRAKSKARRKASSL
jgi:hypothetical protein